MKKYLNSLLLLWSFTGAQAVEIIIDPHTTYQTIGGWGWVNSLPSDLSPEFREELIFEIVDQFGLNRQRFEIPAGNKYHSHRWEWSNDDADPKHTTWDNFTLDLLDQRIRETTAPFVQHVRDRGDPYDMFVSFSFYDGGSSGPPPAWILNNPGEYVEFAMSLLLRLKHVYGLEANHICILNEPGYHNVFALSTIRDKIAVLGPRMAAAGLKTRIQYPEAVNVGNAMNTFITPTASDDDMWSWIGNISYHRYGSTSLLPDLAAFAASKNLTTAMTEHSNLNIDRLYEDLTVGNISYWDVYGIGSEIDLTNYNHLVRKNWYWRFRQITQYVRPGAVRVAASSDDSQLRTLAWDKDGAMVLNLLNNSDNVTRTVNIQGLPPGTYGLSGARSTAAPIERGIQTVGAGGTLTLTLPGSTIYTLYPVSGGNIPPYFTDFRPSVGHLIAPQSSFDLIADAQDPELDSLSYQWTVLQQPTGAAVTLATPQAATCTASNLSVAGSYTFNVEVTDGTNAVNRHVRMDLFTSNPAPVIFDLQNRSPVRVTLPDSSTSLRSSVRDRNGDTLSYQWSIVSQPQGATVSFETPTDDRTVVNGLTVAGDYVFRITADDGSTQVSLDHTVPVYPLNNTPVVSASASPTSLSLPAAQASLTAVCSDPDNDPVTHWWKLISAPAGARPVIESPGQQVTTVKGMIVPGDYVFQNIVTDETKTAFSSNVTVTVTAGASPELIFLTSPGGGEVFTPGQQINLLWTSTHFSDPVKIEFYDGSSWSEITASTDNDGIEAWTVPSTPAEGCKIRVSDAADGDPSDESDTAFGIYAPLPITNLTLDPASATLTWPTLPGGYEYQMYYTDSLDPIDWQPLGAPAQVGGLEYERMQTDSDNGISMRFYKVEEQVIE
ncbi:glycoside hydrolase family 30 beta sandwich domain-containing protein [Kiritimatiellaeota bacterium B1221]|nr:glycoside hydrolase family 30 beta sandwich domain-containing protein [Kiritimatiellaeota bacterium B1221]